MLLLKFLYASSSSCGTLPLLLFLSKYQIAILIFANTPITCISTSFGVVKPSENTHVNALLIQSLVLPVHPPLLSSSHSRQCTPHFPSPLTSSTLMFLRVHKSSKLVCINSLLTQVLVAPAYHPSSSPSFTSNITHHLFSGHFRDLILRYPGVFQPDKHAHISALSM